MRHSLSRLVLAFSPPGTRPRQVLPERFRRWSCGNADGAEDTLEDGGLGVTARLHRRWPEVDQPALARSDDGDITLLLDGFVLGAGPGADSDLLLERYRARGPAFAEGLSGWFAALVVDRAAKRAVLATDRYGMHQLHVTRTAEGIFVATDVRSLLEVADLEARRDDAGLADFIAYGGILNDRTLFEGIQRMPPAAQWTWDGRVCDETQHFDFTQMVGHAPLREGAEAMDAVEETFARVVPRYLERSHDLSFSLSGGLDTRALSPFIDRPIRTHTYGSNPRSLDNRIAQKVSAALGCSHQFLHVSDAFYSQFHQRAVDALELGNGMSHVEDAFTLYVADQLDDGVHKMLTGKYGTQVVQGVKAGVYGGRYLFALEPVARDLKTRLEESARASLAAAEARLGGDLEGHDRDLMFIVLEENRRGWSGQLAAERGRLHHLAPYVDHDIIQLMFRLPPSMRHGQALQLALIARGRTDLAGLPMNRGLLARSTGARSRLSALRFKGLYWLDIAANARRIPPKLRVEVLPWARLGTTQFRQWWRGPLAQWVRDILLDPVSLSRGVFERAAIEGAVAEHLGRRADRSVELSKMLSLELTHRLFFDRR
jgi:asparagine synthase (glutamine-hydrolysing)